MAELKDNEKIKTIAFYLPQYHTIPENDKYWGQGFTEWTNTKKAKPLFEGHYQPKTPLNENYYNLLDDDVKIWQAELAKKYGLYGFCYYHYWFKGGKKLLEKPLEQMLQNKKVDLPFCLCWANESWTKNWDGGNKEVIVLQEYGNQDEWKLHFDYLKDFFLDERYITLNGKPVFLIYKPELIPNVSEMLKFWNEEAKKIGLDGICFMIQNSSWYYTPSFDMTGFSYQIRFQPHDSMRYESKNMNYVKMEQKCYRIIKKLHLNKLYDTFRNKVSTYRQKSRSSELTTRSYDEAWNTILNSKSDSNIVEGAFVDWDNTARKVTGMLHEGATPEKFEKYMKKLYMKIEKNNSLPVVFLNAWNEWGEGAYLEPDTLHEYKYLEALKKANNSYNKKEG